MSNPALLRLLAWLSPAFPTGGFAYSHGLEWAVESGDITDGSSLQRWVSDVLRVGSARNDTILLRHAHRATCGFGDQPRDEGRGSAIREFDPTAPAGRGWPVLGDHDGERPVRPAMQFGGFPVSDATPVAVETAPGAATTVPLTPGPATSGGANAIRLTTGPAIPVTPTPVPAVAGAATSVSATLAALVELAAATAPSRERRAEARDQGRAFLQAAAVWAVPPLGPETPYCIAVGATAGRHGLPEDDTAAAYLQAFATNLISAAVRVVPLGQTAGLRVLAGLEPIILSSVAATRSATLDDLGGCAFRSDLAAMRHETQYTRLFRS